MGSDGTGTVAADRRYRAIVLAGLNVLDLVLLVALLFAALRGARQGAVSQVLAFGGAAVGLVLGAAFAPRLAAQVVDGPGWELALATLAVLVVAIFLGQAVGFTVGLRLRAAADRVGAGPVDRVAGVAFGVASLLLGVWLLGTALQQGPVPLLARQVTESRVVRTVGAALPPAPDLFSRVGTFLSRQGFPQVFSGLGAVPTAPPVAPPDGAVVAAVQAAAAPSAVQVQAAGCGGVSSGSGFVTQPGFVVTNAHVVAGGDTLTVRDGGGTHDAVAVLVDPGLDLAVLSAPTSTAPPIDFTSTPSERDAPGATFGYPGGQLDLAVKPAAVRERGSAVGRDIYGRGLIDREVLTLSAGVVQGDSGGPFVTGDGQVGGVVFAAAAGEAGTGYALTAERVAGPIAEAVATATPVDTGACRY